MAWYRTGTVGVTANSTNVVGTGTAWIENVRAGDGLQGPDGRMYEITKVSSDTALSITPDYQGGTESGRAYWIVPVLGYTKRLADRAAELIDIYAGIEPSDVLLKSKNLSDLSNKTEARQSLELGRLAVLTEGSSVEDKAAARSILALGTAAGSDVTTSATDQTIGRMLKFNDFGLGGYLNVPAGNVLTHDLPTGNFYCAGNTGLPAGVGTYGFLDVKRFNTNYRQLTYRPWDTTSAWANAFSNGSWTGWKQTYNESSVVFTENVNGRSWRYPDGLQICETPFNTYPATSTTTSSGSFPQSFLAGQRATVSACVVPTSNYDPTWTAWGGGTSWSFRTERNLPGNVFSIFAIGRYK
ncbi:MAG: hypothetical protein ABN482_09745 [Corticimicrobacter sp.]|uniref:hypothetical protein n=1 Tax=Corticimicrobacter sp. TaxID=2678536 RepID=UPI0032DB00A8